MKFGKSVWKTHSRNATTVRVLIKCDISHVETKLSMTDRPSNGAPINSKYDRTRKVKSVLDIGVEVNKDVSISCPSRIDSSSKPMASMA